MWGCIGNTGCGEIENGGWEGYKKEEKELEYPYEKNEGIELGEHKFKEWKRLPVNDNQNIEWNQYMMFQFKVKN